MAVFEGAGHGDLVLVLVDAGDEAGERKAGKGGVADGVDGVVRRGVAWLGADNGREAEDKECETDEEVFAYAATISQVLPVAVNQYAMRKTPGVRG